jgi:undecaprenyl diphosphate synthase
VKNPDIFRPEGSVPAHVAFIMDGNRRWARQRMMPVMMGHRKAMAGIRPLVEECHRLGVRYLTFFAFSTENWARPQDQVTGLMDLFHETLQERLLELEENKVRICFLGSREKLGAGLVQLMQDAEARTKACDGIQVNVALNYGGRQDIVQAARRAAERCLEAGRPLASLSEQDLADHLGTTGMPEPDLLVRTSGEHRISNFLIWQMAYTEMVFTETLWPDFDVSCLHHVLGVWQGRDRRFGGDGPGKDKSGERNPS